jgi:hypothetical protein
MPTTTNYGWTTPADTDLVKDGASAIRTLGTAIDTTVFNNAGAAIAKTIVDAKGDIIVATAADTVARLASSGVNGDVLQVDTSTATGLKYAAVAAGANWSLLNSGGTSLTGAATITVSGISAIDKILVLVDGASAANNNASISVRLNTDTGSNYYSYGMRLAWASTYSSSGFVSQQGANTSIFLGKLPSAASDTTVSGYAVFSGCNAAGVKAFTAAGSGNQSGGDAGHQSFVLGGYYNSASTISSISVFSNSGNFDAGTVYVYTSA